MDARAPRSPGSRRPTSSLRTSSPGCRRSLLLVRVDSRIEVPADLDAADLPALAERAAADPAPQQLEVGTAAEISNNDLDGIVADVDRERRAALLAVAPAVVSLVLVALALLSRLTSAAGELRVPDLALASLRGADRRRTWLLALSEPLLLVALAVPVGVAGGAALTWALVRAWLPAGLPVPVPAYAVLASVAVVACAVAVCVVSTRAVLARSLADQLSGQARPRPAGRLAVLVALALVALTLVLVVAALTRPAGGATDAADLVLPLLIAAVLGLAAAGGTRAAARALARRPARGVAGFLAVRAVARRSVGTLVVLPLTIAIAVVTFGAGTFDAAGAWRASVAATQAPASTVWSSELPMSEAVALTHRLDPDGRWLMATGTWNAQDGVYVVADVPRLPTASLWDPSWTPGHSVDDVVALITRPPTPPLTGARLRLGLTVPRAAEEVTVEMRMRTVGRRHLQRVRRTVRARHVHRHRARPVRARLHGRGASPSPDRPACPPSSPGSTSSVRSRPTAPMPPTCSPAATGTSSTRASPRPRRTCGSTAPASSSPPTGPARPP